MISLLPSTNANLANLILSAGTLRPPSTRDILRYAAGCSLCRFHHHAHSRARRSTNPRVTINGVPVALDVASAPLAILAVGANVIVTEVTAGDGINGENLYAHRHARAAAVRRDRRGHATSRMLPATLHGTVTPNGPATVLFQYRPHCSYGNSTPGQDVSGTTSAARAGGPDRLGGRYDLSFPDRRHDRRRDVYGDDMAFTTTPDRPLVATGRSGRCHHHRATLIGAVNPNGLDTTVYFEYGRTNAYGTDHAASDDPGRNSMRGHFRRPSTA